MKSIKNFEAYDCGGKRLVWEVWGGVEWGGVGRVKREKEKKCSKQKNEMNEAAKGNSH